MHDQMTYVALIPAYQPGGALLDSLRNLHSEGFQIVVVDDGSGASYQDVFLQAESLAAVLSYEENRGKGYALKRGFQYIKAQFAAPYIVATVDADGQHQILDAVKACRSAEADPACMVLGSRRLKEKAPLRSRFGNSMTRGIFSMLTGRHIYDTQTGLRAFGDQLLPFLLEIQGERYEYEMNVLLASVRSNIPVKEVEIAAIYMDGNKSSHFRTVKDSYRIYREIIRFSLSSLFCFLADYALYSLLLVLTGGMEPVWSLLASNVLARVVSGSINYTVNRHYVFGDTRKKAKTLRRYIGLALFILACNTAILTILTEKLKAGHHVAKLAVESGIFLFSWLMQRFFIFHRKGGEADGSSQTLSSEKI